MGANNSNTKFHQNICNTPPKPSTRLLFDPRSPSGIIFIINPFFKIFCLDGISRTPIQIDSQVPVPPIRLYNHVMPYITGPDLILREENNENNDDEQKLDVDENEPKRTSVVEPTLDPTKVLTALVANNNGQLPPYQL
jgi:hypothetical protein